MTNLAGGYTRKRDIVSVDTRAPSAFPKYTKVSCFKMPYIHQETLANKFIIVRRKGTLSADRRSKTSLSVDRGARKLAIDSMF
jgi:hypothetical protein